MDGRCLQHKQLRQLNIEVVKVVSVVIVVGADQKILRIVKYCRLLSKFVVKDKHKMFYEDNLRQFSTTRDKE